MNSRFKKALACMAALAALVLYASPYIAVHQMRSAAAERDAVRLSGFVDFPALRESLKRGVHARLAGQVLNESGQPTPAGAMGAAVAAALLGPMVDSLITPDSVGRLLQGQRPGAALAGVSRDSAADEPLQTRMGYESPRRFVVSVQQAGEGEEPVDLVLRREGLLHWKLAELRLP
jgi:Protein of unknown function (DUF2939)